MAIGTLGERSLHAYVKLHYDPTGEYHEVPVGRYVADILRPNGEIIEVQTQGFDRLRRKLAAFLPEHIVTVVCPIAHTKLVTWLDVETGEVLREKRSPKKWSAYDAFSELYKIKALLHEPNLRLRILLLDVTEYRYATRKNRKGYSRLDTIPHDVIGEMSLDSAADFAKLVPPSLPDEFTSFDYAKASRLRVPDAQRAVNVLSHVGALARVGKDGNRIIYTRAE